MNLIFLGPPGVGKGTQARLVCENYGIIHLSTGDILRSEIKDSSEVGKVAKSYIDEGALVPDNVLLDIINLRLSKNDSQNGYLLDGFPRTIGQAEGLYDIMNIKKHKLDVAISLVAEENELIQRLINRGHDSGRTDDTPEIIKQRQEVYWKQTAPLIDFYSNKNVLVEINGIGSIPEIKNRIFMELDHYA
tara:strand:- start:981 stop:1550 length:570 start_codon:yes stop_codon:yes gene_type:complete